MHGFLELGLARASGEVVVEAFVVIYVVVGWHERWWGALQAGLAGRPRW
jgi:hypothetical protein